MGVRLGADLRRPEPLHSHGVVPTHARPTETEEDHPGPLARLLVTDVRLPRLHRGHTPMTCTRCHGLGHIEPLTVPDVEQEPCQLCGGSGVTEDNE